jgi:pimeloyl-ACP methyl ester carboxylesterase
VPEVHIGSGTIYYEIAGQGFPLVLLHGIGSNSRSWSRQIHGLSANFTVIAWDAPGYGRSFDPPMTVARPSMTYYADRLHEFLDAIHLQRVFLVGHSFGGMVAQEFYRTYADSVRALILADTRDLGVRAGLERRLNAIRTMPPAAIAAERAPKLLSHGASRSLVEEVAGIMADIHPAGYEFALKSMADCDTRNVIRNLHVPTLLIWGEDDEITPLKDAFPLDGFEFKLIRNAGHLCYIEQPDEFNDAVREFLLKCG